MLSAVSHISIHPRNPALANDVLRSALYADDLCLLFAGFPSFPRELLQTQVSKVPLALMCASAVLGVPAK